MLELVPRIEEIWNRQHEEVLDSAEKITLYYPEYDLRVCRRGNRGSNNGGSL